MGVVSTGALGGAETTTSTTQRLSEDELFEMLSNARRRYVMHTLIREGDRVDVGSLSEQIAAWEDDRTLDEITSKDRKRVYTALQQTHLPKMDRAGVIDYDHNRGTVAPTQELENVEIYMDVVRGREIPWSDYYIGLTALIAIVLGGTALGIAPFTAVPSTAWMAFVVVTLAVSAVAHRYFSRRNRLGLTAEPPEYEARHRNGDAP